MKRLLILISLIVILAGAGWALYGMRSVEPEKTLESSGLSCAAYHSGVNSPFEKAICRLPSGKELKPGEVLSGYRYPNAVFPQLCGAVVETRCNPGGRLSDSPSLFKRCVQHCLDPVTGQPVAAGTELKYFTISAGTAEQCEKAERVSVCNAGSGEFTPGLETKMHASCSVVSAEESKIMLWSDPNTWGGTLPGPGANVLIPDGRLIILDVDPPPLSLLQIDGVLIFSHEDRLLAMHMLFLRGSLQVGSPSAKFEKSAVVRITKPPASSGRKQGMFMMAGGQFDLHGLPVSDEERQTSGDTYPWGARRHSNIKIEVEQ